MSAAPGLEALATGALFGLSAGLSPGPLLALVITQTVRHGPGQGARVAMAPLLTDVPIVLISVLLVGVVTGSGLAVGAIALVGAMVVAWIARDTWRSEPPGSPETPPEGDAVAARAAGEAVDRVADPAPHSWARGAAVNALSPHPWLFWMAVGAPTVIAAYQAGGVVAAAAFLLGFYACLIGSKVGIAMLVGQARGRVAGRGYRWLMRGLAIVLAVFALGLLREGVLALTGT